MPRHVARGHGQRLSEQELGVGARGVGSVLLDVVGGELEDLDDRQLAEGLPPLSWAARSAAISAETTSSRSPAITRSSLCRVKLMRWSVTRLSLKLYVRIFSDRLPLRTMPRCCALIDSCCSASFIS